MWVRLVCDHTEAGLRSVYELSETDPFPIQQQVDSKDGLVLQRNFLVPVEDLKYPTEHNPIVNSRLRETALTYRKTGLTQRVSTTNTIIRMKLTPASLII